MIFTSKQIITAFEDLYSKKTLPNEKLLEFIEKNISDKNILDTDIQHIKDKCVSEDNLLFIK